MFIPPVSFPSILPQRPRIPKKGVKLQTVPWDLPTNPSPPVGVFAPVSFIRLGCHS